MKKIMIFILVNISLFANIVSKQECLKEKENFIYAGGECINYFVEDGEREGILNIVIHGAWKDGSNTLARYSTFATDITINTDITTVAVALPGYSKSSSNSLKALLHKTDKPVGSTHKEYVEFIVSLIEALKNKYKAKTINIIAHSAGAILSATVTGFKPNLIQNVILAGGQYTLSKFNKTKNSITVDQYLNKIPKNTNFLLVYGDKDKISAPDVTKSFYKQLKKRNLNAKLVKAKNHAHLDLDMSNENMEAMVLMFEKIN